MISDSNSIEFVKYVKSGTITTSPERHHHLKSSSKTSLDGRPLLKTSFSLERYPCFRESSSPRAAEKSCFVGNTESQLSSSFEITEEVESRALFEDNGLVVVDPGSAGEVVIERSSQDDFFEIAAFSFHLGNCVPV